MTIEKYAFEREVVCDSCGDGFGQTYPADEFDTMIQDVKAAGWKLVKEEGSWFHYCHVCQGK